jgi:hypothetical protein
MDPQSLFPIHHRSVEVRRDLLALRARGALVAVRTELINATRGLVKSMDASLPKCSTQEFANKAERELPAEVREILLPLVEIAKSVSELIQSYDERIEKLATEKYQQTSLLRQVKGVGPVTSPAYVLTLEDPNRFSRSRDVGPDIGLVPKQEDSGDRQPQLRISKMGDVMVWYLTSQRMAPAHWACSRCWGWAVIGPPGRGWTNCGARWFDPVAIGCRVGWKWTRPFGVSPEEGAIGRGILWPAFIVSLKIALSLAARSVPMAGRATQDWRRRDMVTR